MIELKRVSKRYRGRVDSPVFQEIDLVVEPGEVVLVSGATGAGKSTLIKLLYAAEFADRGRVSVFGRDLARLRRSSIAILRRHLGVVPQSFALLRDMSALRNVALAMEVRAAPMRDILMRAAEALGSMGMTSSVDTLVSALSEGERQRVAIARALVGEPSVLVADEPTAHLDSEGREMFIDALIDVQSRGGCAVVATNDHALIAAGARCAWRHVELWDGALQVIADRRPSLVDTAADFSDDTPEDTGEFPALRPDEDEARQEWEETIDTNVVAFPVAARAGALTP
jgi:cell division transport system ATP-binding protein